MSLAQNRRDWEDLATIDPLWAILSDAGRREGGWDDAEFTATGRAEVEALMNRAQSFGLPHRRRTALDFGCGVGRLTRPLADHFDHCVGVDISAGMVAQARRRNASVPNLDFRTNDSDALPDIADGSVDLVYSGLVLQHVASRAVIRAYLAEFARVLASGGLLVFQLPSFIPLRHRLQPRPRLYNRLRALGVPSSVLYRWMHLQPIRMRWLPVDDVREVLEGRGLRVLDAETTHVNRIASTAYHATRA